MDKQVNGMKHTTKVYSEDNLGDVLRMAQETVIIGEVRNTQELEKVLDASNSTKKLLDSVHR